ncbi:MAG: FKBP-type peptidyl-prolyl cis-trans isomerase, partial [Planctomycetota bacterium]
MAEVKAGDRVHLLYTGRLEDGTVFDATGEDQPIEFVAGDGELIQGVDNAVLGMSAGEKKTVTIAADQGYGPRRDELVEKVPISALPDDVEVGDELTAESEDGKVHVWVTEMGDDE